MKIVKSIVAIFIIMIFANFAYAASYTANASPATVGVNSNTRSVGITFTTPTRNLVIKNNDATEYAWVDLKSATNTSNRKACYLLDPDSTLTLYDYATDGISIIWDNQYSSLSAEASPISIIATY